jgi:hypothetical protein
MSRKYWLPFERIDAYQNHWMLEEDKSKKGKLLYHRNHRTHLQLHAFAFGIAVMIDTSKLQRSMQRAEMADLK